MAASTDHSALTSTCGLRAAWEPLACACIASGLWLVETSATDPDLLVALPLAEPAGALAEPTGDALAEVADA
jgi:hypothetical protein